MRARRTRLKLLRAIADLEGSASFSEIRKTTGLSTGSIYYHLERMASYVVKDSKHYVITQKGLQLLHEIDSKPPASSHDSSTHSFTPISIDEQRLTIPKVQPRISIKRPCNTYGSLLTKSFGDYAFLSIIIGSLVFISMALIVGTHIIFPSVSSAGKMISNASLISSLSIAALLSVSFLIMLKRQMLPSGYRGIILSALTVLSVLVVNILIFSGLGSQISVNSSVSSAGKMISNASLISSLSIAALLSVSFLIMLKRQMLPSGYRGIILSALTVLSVLVVNILIFSGLGSQISVISTTF